MHSSAWDFQTSLEVGVHESKWVHDSITGRCKCASMGCLYVDMLSIAGSWVLNSAYQLCDVLLQHSYAFAHTSYSFLIIQQLPKIPVCSWM